MSFVNRDFLAACLDDSAERVKIHPSFILAVLALAQLMGSSNAEQGTPGMAEAVKLKLQAQGALDQARQAGLLNADLAKAQFVSPVSSYDFYVHSLTGVSQLLAIFESSAFTEHSYARASATLHALDEVLASLSLTTNDMHDPTVSSFPHGTVPVVFLDDGPPLAGRNCKCLPHEENDAARDYSSRVYHLPWNPEWTSAQIHDEEIRRLCWAALGIISEHNAQCMALGREVPNFYLNNPGNVSPPLPFRCKCVLIRGHFNLVFPPFPWRGY